jgi:ADP-ribose pyrophosphatase YjhB (NUDIX family)
MFTIGAFAIIFNENEEVLLSHRRDMDIWNLPGGGVEPHEMPDEAVIREVKEETGMDVTIERLVGVYGKVEKDELVFAFVCQVTGGQLILTDEADQHNYFAGDVIPSNTSPKQVERIHDAMKQTTQPIFRRQTAPSTRSIIGENK